MPIGKQLIEIALTQVVVLLRFTGIDALPLGIKNPTLLRRVDQQVRFQAEHLSAVMPAQVVPAGL
ncbi:hypothetical protein D9M70_583190 [compost metagenome]